jgi:polar amino acid transport system substrate-binding protein
MKLRYAALTLWLGLFATGCAFATQVTDYCERPVKVALFEFGVLYRASTDDGIDKQLLDEIGKRTGCEFQRVVLPRNRIWAELQYGSLDLATGAIPTPERAAYGFLLPYMKSRNLVLVRKSLASQIQSLSDLERSKARVGVVRGFRHEAAYDQLIASLTQRNQVVSAADVSEDFRLFDRGIVDIILSQPIVFGQYLSQDYLASNVTFRDFAPKNEISIGALILSRKSFTSDQARRWDALIVRLQKDGTLLRIYQNFLASSQATDLVYTGPRSQE